MEEEAFEIKFQHEMENEEKLLEAETEAEIRHHDVRCRSLAFAAGPGGVAPTTTQLGKLPKLTITSVNGSHLY